MRKILKSLMVALILVTCITACGNNTKESNKEILYNAEMNSDINVEEYSKAVSEILTYKNFDDTAKIMIENKYENLVSPNVFYQLNTISNNSKIIYPGINTNTLDINSSLGYPVYDSNFSIVDYGTYDEYIESVKLFNALDLNYIENVEASNDKLIVKINNKYNGVFYMYAFLNNGKINYINLLK